MRKEVVVFVRPENMLTQNDEKYVVTELDEINTLFTDGWLLDKKETLQTDNKYSFIIIYSLYKNS